MAGAHLLVALEMAKGKSSTSDDTANCMGAGDEILEVNVIATQMHAVGATSTLPRRGYAPLVNLKQQRGYAALPRPKLYLKHCLSARSVINCMVRANVEDGFLRMRRNHMKS